MACLAATRANFGKIQRGMTREQVEAILGEPSSMEDRDEETHICCWWRGLNVSGFVTFYPKRHPRFLAPCAPHPALRGKVDGVGWGDRPTIFARLRAWLGW
jgi:SmpA / OmlA family